MQIPERIVKANEALESLKTSILGIAESATQMANGIKEFTAQLREMQMAQIPESKVAEYKSKLFEHAVKDFSFTEDELAQFALSLTDRQLREYVLDKARYDNVVGMYCWNISRGITKATECL